MGQVKAVPEGMHTITPQLAIDGCAKAMEWYKKAFGAEETSRAPDPQYGTHSLAECCEPDVQGTPPSTKKDES